MADGAPFQPKPGPPSCASAGCRPWAGRPHPKGIYMARERHCVPWPRWATTGSWLAVQWLGHAGEHLDLLAEELRLAQQAPGRDHRRVFGRRPAGEIFSRFCIGK